MRGLARIKPGRVNKHDLIKSRRLYVRPSATALVKNRSRVTSWSAPLWHCTTATSVYNSTSTLSTTANCVVRLLDNVLKWQSFHVDLLMSCC